MKTKSGFEAVCFTMVGSKYLLSNIPKLNIKII